MGKKKLLVVLGSGGHTTQMLRLIDRLGDRYDYEYVVAKDDMVSEKHINPKYSGKIYRAFNPRRKRDYNKAVIVGKFVPATFSAIKILKNSNADTIIGNGPAVCMPILYLAKKLFRKKVIFFESWVRVKNKSQAGRLLYPHADLFMVQWPEMTKTYPKAVYGGRLG